MAVESEDVTPRESLRRLATSPSFLSVMSITTIIPIGVAISPALPGMADSLNVSDARIGLVITALTLPPMLISPIVGIAGDIFGRRIIAIPGLLLFGIGGVGIAFADSFALVLVLRGVQGVAMAGIAPLTITLLGDMYTGTQRTTAQGIRTSIGGVALAVGPVLAGALAGIKWQYPFYLFVLSIFVMIPVYLYVPETVQVNETGDSIRGSLIDYKESIVDEIDDISLLVVMVGGFVRFFSLFAFITFVPIYAVRVLDTTPFLAGLVIAMAGIRIVLSPTAGWWVSRLSRRWTLLFTLGFQAICFALIPFVPGIWSLGVLAVLFGIGDSLFDPVVNDIVTSMVADKNRNGVVGGLRVLKEAGKTAAPAGLGVILSFFDYELMFISIAAVVILYGVGIFFLMKHHW